MRQETNSLFLSTYNSYRENSTKVQNFLGLGWKDDYILNCFGSDVQSIRVKADKGSTVLSYKPYVSYSDIILSFIGFTRERDIELNNQNVLVNGVS